MTTLEIILVTVFYFAALVAVSYFTRAKGRRIVGAFAGGAAFGIVAMLAIVLGEAQRLWKVPMLHTWEYQFLYWLGFAVSCTPTNLVIWRIVRRFGGRGLAVCAIVATIIGPPRDYGIVAMFPAWMTFAPGLAPVLADAAVYTLLVLVGYGVMRLVAGPATADPLARS